MRGGAIRQAKGEEGERCIGMQSEGVRDSGGCPTGGGRVVIKSVLECKQTRKRRGGRGVIKRVLECKQTKMSARVMHTRH